MIKRKTTDEDLAIAVDARIRDLKDRLDLKGNEYVRDADRLHNFRSVAAFNDTTMETALWGMLSKHLCSIKDMIKDAERGTAWDQHIWNEKIGDAMAYLALLDVIRQEARKHHEA